MSESPYFTDAQVDEMCDGLAQDAAKIRFLRRLGLRVDRKPNGRPLAWKPTAANEQAPGTNGPNVVALQRMREGRERGQKAQGR